MPQVLGRAALFDLLFKPIPQILLPRPSYIGACLTSSRRVAAALLLPKDIEEEDHCLSLGFEMVAHRLALCSDPSPTPCQACCPKQVGLDGHRIKAGHVFRDVCPLDVEAVGLCDHAGMILSPRLPVQREF